jgi:hypothetical protein
MFGSVAFFGHQATIDQGSRPDSTQQIQSSFDAIERHFITLPLCSRCASVYVMLTVIETGHALF